MHLTSVAVALNTRCRHVEHDRDAVGLQNCCQHRRNRGILFGQKVLRTLCDGDNRSKSRIDLRQFATDSGPTEDDQRWRPLNRAKGL
jgi:hypothetical protein